MNKIIELSEHYWLDYHSSFFVFLSDAEVYLQYR